MRGGKRREFWVGKETERDLQMAMLAKLAILDETDSGLELMSRTFPGGNTYAARLGIPLDQAYQRLLEYMCRTCACMVGADRRTGGKDLALQLEDKGYD